jgi:NAD-dependent dihydropyrimidine dehydrogenase PreA subunit
VADLYADALLVKDRYRAGSGILGAFLGLVIGIKLLQAVIRRRRDDYEVQRSSCLSCGRCYFYCPQEHARLKDQGITVLPADVSRQL